MVLKRKRNLKIDATTSYSVFLTRDLNPEEMEDYVEARDTGMEADEEKEIHLQNIIKGQKSDIPLPVITEITNVSRSFFPEKSLKRRIVWEKDCENLYIENKEDLQEEESIIGNELSAAKERGPVSPAHAGPLEEDTKLHEVSDNGLDGVVATRQGDKEPDGLDLLGLINKMGDNKSETLNRSEGVINFCLRRSILRYERRGYEAYSCFRDRIFRPTFKSRRNEALMIEKLGRMGTELGTLENMCSLLKEKYRLELRALKKTTRALGIINSTRLDKSKRKALKRLMVEGPPKSTHNATPANLHGIMTNREKIMTMRSLRVSPELYLDIKYYSEVMGLIRNSEESEQENDRKKVCRICFDERADSEFR